MAIQFKILLIVVLTGIAYQDLRIRKVFWFLFPLALILVVANDMYIKGLPDISYTLFVNIIVGCLLFVLSILLTSKLFLLEKKTKYTNIIGWGDLLFIPVLAAHFDTFFFLVFIITSNILILLIWGILNFLSLTKHETIPLAGYWSILFCIFIIIEWVSLPNSIIY